ncbi:phytanoyl-CoA dioxygenase family protein [Paenibacillus spongiae]|uniref:Phytanoyl-CoA dioxygenase family protein n=1 Tax=Paenibacillus spongiae TaxID=2909671 RepID=A0ABY5S3G8_9BACL|nr:phytanoyl-CoA dioxygenase family protein [Paenibacillus spongiae]UVI28449.1 phytanoyl-CoA dioxygenase family protein [Paenibacillus spongiae]
MGLSKEQLEQFQENGFLVIGPLLTEDELAALRSRIDALASGEDPLSARVGIRLEADAEKLKQESKLNKVWQIMDASSYDETIARHARNPQILDIVEQLLGTSDIKLFGDQTLMKPAHHGSPVSWHQDSGYWTQISPPALVNCWTALDDATIENGCVRYVPGSHKRGVLEHHRENDGFLHVRDFDPNQAVPAEVPAGWCAFHHSCTIHSSGPNLSPNRRRGLVTSYMRADSEWVGAIGRKAFPLVRGREYEGRV